MPNFKITQRQTAASVKVNFDSVWGIVDPANVSHDNHGVYSYVGEGGSNEKDIGSIRTLSPLDPSMSEGMSSFEVTLLDTGELNYMAMGVCDLSYPTHLLPGWEQTSVAFHTDEGSLFNSSDDAVPLNIPCSKNDVIKVSISTCVKDSTKVAVDFYRNGANIAHISTELPPDGFYGVVGLMSRGEKIRISQPVITKRAEFEQFWDVSTPHTITHDGCGICSYSGSGDFKETSIGTIRTKSAIDPLGVISKRCLEVRIINPGEARYIAVGVVSGSYPSNMFPGWEEPSIGYHADNGNLFCGKEQQTNHPCKEGDLMKCTVDPIDGVSKRVRVTFHRNHVEVGQVTAWTPAGGFHLCVGMMSRKEKIQVVLPEIVSPYTSLKQNVQFEDFWELLNPNLEHQGGGVYRYSGLGGIGDVGSIRSKEPVDPFKSGNWFEIKILSPGEHCYIALGVCSNHYSPGMLLGWEDLSVGFHADNGLILQSNVGEQSTSHPCQPGDVIRCTIEPIDGSIKQVKVHFHRNSELAGTVTFWKPTLKGFYAQIGCMSVGEVVQIASPLMGLPALRPGVEIVPRITPATVSPPHGQGEAMRKKQASSQHPYQPPQPGPQFVSKSGGGEQGTGGDIPQMYDPHSYYYHYNPRMMHHHQMHHRFPHHQPPPGMFPPYYGYPGGYGPHQHTLPRSPYMGRAIDQRQLPNHLPLYGDPNASFPPTRPSPDQSRKLQPQFSEPTVLTSSQEHLGVSDAASRQDSSGKNSYAAQISSASSASDTLAPNDSLGGVFSPSHDADKLPGQSVFKDDGHGYSAGKGNWTPLGQYNYPSSNTATSPLNEPKIHVDKSSLKGFEGSLHPSKFQSSQDKERQDLKYLPGGTDHTDANSDCCCVPDEQPSLQRVNESFTTVSEQTVESISSRYDQPKLDVLDSTPPPYPPTTQPVTNQEMITNKARVRPPLLSQVSVSSTARKIPKEENKTFKVLHNVNSEDSNGPFESTLPEDEMLDNAYVISRLPLSEKIPYFEVEIQHIGTNGNVAIGLVWDNYPVFHLPGALQGSIAFHSQTRSVLTEGAEVDSDQAISPCGQGDVIGCRALLQYKSEVSDNKENSVNVEFYLNGRIQTTTRVILPPSGFFPAIGFKGYRSKIKFSQSIQLSPETYFETHTLPKNFHNFPSPPPLVSGWHCLKNAEVTDDSKLFMIQQRSGNPSVIQNYAPLSKTSTYFEVELHCPVSSYSVLAIGAMPKTFAESKKIIPGEASNSVGFLPLLGFIMKNSAISCTVPEVVSSELYLKNTTIGVGIDFLASAPSIETSTTCDKLESSVDLPPKARVKMFFTINGQQVSCIFSSLPEGGFYPTLAIDSDSIKKSNCLASVHFPAQWPLFHRLPLGFARGTENKYKLYDLTTFIDQNSDAENSSVRAMQAAAPLSPSNSYYEIRVISGGETFRISCGLASYNYPMNVHPGWNKDSIALHTDDGNLFHDGTHKPVCPPCHYRGATVGCGIRFPDDGNTRFAEVFFTLDRKMVAKRFVKVPQLGLFPTVGIRTGRAIVTIDLSVPDPFPDMRFNTTWGEIRNMRVEGTSVQLASRTEPGAVIQALPLETSNVIYFTVTPLGEKEGRIMVGFSTSRDCPLNLLQSNIKDLKAFAIDITLGVVMIYDQYFQSKDACAVQNGVEFGCGLLPQPSLNKSLFFITVDHQAVSYTVVDYVNDKVYPFVMMIESPTKVSVNLCALWPITSPAGQGWARYANVKLQNCQLTHSALQTKRKFPVGFLQSSTPISPISPYFEIEVCSRASNKAIAIGLASTRYPSNSWVGWSNESIGYHLDDGKLFKVSSFGTNFGPKAFAGDIVGCGVRFGTTGPSGAVKGGEKLEVFFTINGGLIGTQKVTIPSGGMFPTVCIESPSEAVIFHLHSQFPPTPSMVSTKDWNSAYSVVQSGLVIKNSFRHGEVSGSVPKGFCQAKNPFSPEKNYFEVQIAGCSGQSQLQAGLSTIIPEGCTSPNTYGVLYSIGGQIITRKGTGGKAGTQKYTTHAQRASIGDRLGCAVIFTGDTPTSVEFYLNCMKVTEVSIASLWRKQPVYPTIVFTQREDAAIPLLGLPKPTWDPTSLAGWLRSERVKLRNRVIEYNGPGKTVIDVGVAQTSQALQLRKNSYFELEILDPGEKCTIAIGVAPADYRLDMHPGWDQDSIAYHGDDGYIFQASGTGSPFGPVWQMNDVIGLGVRSHSGTPSQEVQVFFTRNGEEIGHTTHSIPSSGLFPIIGLHSVGEKVKIHTNSSSVIPCNIEPKRSSWRSLCGVNVTGSSDGSRQILTFRENGRKPRPSKELNVLVSLAIAVQPFSNSMQYFEVDLLGVGFIGIAVGVAPSNYPLDQATGWTEGSVAYHTDDGCLYTSSIKGNVFGPVAHRGDVIGCGVTFAPNNLKHCSVFFTYNGCEIGRVRTNYLEAGLFPSITLTSAKDKVAVRLMETFKPRHPQAMDLFVGLMRIQNCSYSDQLVRFSGAGTSGYTNAPAMAQFAVPLHHNRNYFAANIVKCKDAILIGLAAKDYPMRFAPGGSSVSIAYDIVNGTIRAVYASDNHYHMEAPVCKQGDTVGCGIDLQESGTKGEGEYIFFTRNGVMVCRLKLAEMMDDLFPVVGFIPASKNSVVFMDWATPVYQPQNVF